MKSFTSKLLQIFTYGLFVGLLVSLLTPAKSALAYTYEPAYAGTNYTLTICIAKKPQVAWLTFKDKKTWVKYAAAKVSKSSRKDCEKKYPYILKAPFEVPSTKGEYKVRWEYKIKGKMKKSPVATFPVLEAPTAPTPPSAEPTVLTPQEQEFTDSILDNWYDVLTDDVKMQTCSALKNDSAYREEFYSSAALVGSEQYGIPSPNSKALVEAIYVMACGKYNIKL